MRFLTRPFHRSHETARIILVLAFGLVFLSGACSSLSVEYPPPKEQAAPPLEAEVPLVRAQPPEPAVPPQFDLALPDSEARVALLLPLSGRHAKLGEALLNAAQLALFDIADERFAILIKDTGGTPLGAQNATREAIAEGATLILGPLFATSVTAMADQARISGVNVISFSNDRSVAGGGVFVMGLDPAEQVTRVIDYASIQGNRRFAILSPATAYGNAVLNAFRDTVLRNSAEIAQVTTFDPARRDSSAEVRVLADYDKRHEELLKERARLEALGDEVSKRTLEELERLDTISSPEFDAVMLPAGGRSLLALAPLLPYYDVDPGEIRFLGTALWDDHKLGTEPALLGGWFAAPPPHLWQGFRERFLDAFGSEPPRIASLAYDATALAAVLAGRAIAAGQNRAFDAADIMQPSGFSGVDGIFRFRADGASERGLAVLEMQRERFRLLDPAPQSFERPTT